ncbi:MAG: hypothetical protein EZS28_013001, partial [Streblomastix strix]
MIEDQGLQVLRWL